MSGGLWWGGPTLPDKGNGAKARQDHRTNHNPEPKKRNWHKLQGGKIGQRPTRRNLPSLESQRFDGRRARWLGTKDKPIPRRDLA